MAQAVVTCELCEDDPVLMHCNSCHINLCSECVGKHVSSLLSKQHDVVGFQYRKSDVTLPDCQSHLYQKCDIYCKTCKFSICSKCVVSPEHKQHEITDIIDEYLTRKELLSQEATMLEKFVIPELDKVESSLGSNMTKLTREYDSVTNLLSREVDKLYIEIRKKVEEKKALLKDLQDSDARELRSQLVQISKRNLNVKQVVSDYKVALSGNNVAAVFSCPYTENQFRDIPSMVGICAPKYSPTLEFDKVQALLGKIEILDRCVAKNGYTISTSQNTQSSCVEKKILEEPELLSTFHTEYEELQSIFCVGTNEVWAVGSVRGTMTRFNIDGTKLETLQVIQGYSPNDIHVDYEGNILFTDMGERSVVMWKNGKREVIAAWKNWKPTALFVNKLGHILVCMMSADKRDARIVRLVKTKQKQKIQFDEGEQLFFRPLAIVENKNEDICVVNSGTRGVVVVNKSGILRFTYSGKAPSLTFRFKPTSIAIDSRGQILVTDAMNNCVHILDEDGNFLLSIGKSMMNMPSDLGVDENENLWIGELHSGKIKVFKYLTTRRPDGSVPSAESIPSQ